jgi:hypothetical protein
MIARVPCFCSLCGEPVPSPGASLGPCVFHAPGLLCARCRKLVSDPLARAWTRYAEAGERYGQCAGGLCASPATHLDFRSEALTFFHPMHTPTEAPQVCTSVGLRFFPSRVSLYWIHEPPAREIPVPFGPSLSYRDPAFWDLLESTVAQGARAAWEAGARTCPFCCYHAGPRGHSECLGARKRAV